MANESRVFRLPAGMSTQVVANAVEAFLSSAKGTGRRMKPSTGRNAAAARKLKWATILSVIGR